MISMILPLPVGNALRVFLDVPSGATRWRVLRRVSDTFTGWDDSDALLVIDTNSERSTLDFTSLKNGVLYYYKMYAYISGSWSTSPSMSSTAASVLEDAFADVLELVRDRLNLGLIHDIAAGNLAHEKNHIQVLTAPPVFEDTIFPTVTVHLQSDSSNTRAIGEEMSADYLDGNDVISEEGWLSSVQLTIMGWCLNPDTRIDIRKAIRRIIQGNLPVFDDAGMLQIDVSFSDTEDFSSYGAPMYQVSCTLSCLAPSAVRSRNVSIKTINSYLTP